MVSAAPAIAIVGVGIRWGSGSRGVVWVERGGRRRGRAEFLVGAAGAVESRSAVVWVPHVLRVVIQLSMRPALAALALLLSRATVAACTPADAPAVAAAERAASDAEVKAQHAESIAVRSGNPGAQVRATRARAEATAARGELAKLRCEPAPAPVAPKKQRPLSPPSGY